ncbi:MAG: alpha/beta hydrolase domain-containing protein, partial [Halioglobus sp.]|nr:alpha/beta hydrolase domain-containing protein [Halioglobus sp.]
MFQTALKHSRELCIIAASVTLIACSSSNNDDDFIPQPEYLPIANPTVSLPPDVGTLNLLAQSFDLGDVGYQQREFFIEGTASAFTNIDELGSNGFWALAPAEQATYKTRIVVYSPIDPADFSGIVHQEWLNVTAGFDTPPSNGTGQIEMRRSGAVWVGVSAQLIGIEGSDRSLAPLHLKAVNPERYASLHHPGDAFSYDIFSQVAQAIRNPGDIDPLGGLNAEYIIAYGESQSAGRLTTHANGIQPLYNAFDGYMIHSRGDGASPISQE